MRRISFLLTFLPLLALTALPAAAQYSAPAKKPAAQSGLDDEMLLAWNSTARKLIEMAEDFPEDKYDFKPSPEVRSFRQILLHIAGANYMFINPVKEMGAAEEDPAPEEFKTKKDVVDYLTQSFADGAAVIKEQGEAGQSKAVRHPFADRTTTQHNLWLMGVEHGSEHYGNLVVYYRINGLVPPASRPRR